MQSQILKGDELKNAVVVDNSMCSSHLTFYIGWHSKLREQRGGGGVLKMFTLLYPYIVKWFTRGRGCKKRPKSCSRSL